MVLMRIVRMMMRIMKRMRVVVMTIHIRPEGGFQSKKDHTSVSPFQNWLDELVRNMQSKKKKNSWGPKK